MEDHVEAARSAVEEGFFLEYVMQAAAPATPDAPALAGPHVIEIVIKGAQLTYPLGVMRSFGHDIVEAYSHYVYPSWVSPYPQVRLSSPSGNPTAQPGPVPLSLRCQILHSLDQRALH